MTASRLGHAFALEAVGPGWKLLSRTRTTTGGDVDMPDRLEGTVVEKLAYDELDVSTGEIVDRVVFRLLLWGTTPRWAWLDANDVDTDQLHGLDRAACSRGADRLIEAIYLARRNKRGFWNRDLTDYLHDAATLIKAAL